MINVQQTQTIKLRLWNGRDFKQKISAEHRDSLLEQAMDEINRKVGDGFREGRFELSMETNDLFHCSWEAIFEHEVSE